MPLAQSITDVSVEWPGWRELLAVSTFRAGFNTAVVVLGTTFLGAASGIIGSFALLRKRALMGDALSHAALPGLAAAFIIATLLGGEGKSLPVLLLGATVSGVLGVIAVQLLVQHTRLTEDAAIGAVLSVFFGFGVALMSIIQSMGVGTQSGLHHFIYGQTAAMSREDAVLTGGVALLAMVAAALFFKEFRLVCFDEEFASVQGWPIAVIDLLMMSLVVVVIVIGLQSVGLILSIALLIVPAAAARMWTERLSRVVVLGCLFGGLSGYVGSSASALLPRLPAGAVIVLAAGAWFVLSMLFAPARGVLASVGRHVRMRLRIAREHLLRAAYEAWEAAPTAERIVPVGGRSRRTWADWERRLLWRMILREGLVTRANHHLVLTRRGWEEAVRLTRNHRLWEEYLVRFAHLDPSHVDCSADMVEHVLSPGMIAQIETSLRASGRLPEAATPAPSVHPLSAAARSRG